MFRIYGGRGIRVCERWKSYEAFFADVGARPSAEHSLDRIDTNGHYEPGNVRWATRREQNRNHRYHRWLTHQGETKMLAEWAEETGIGRSTIHLRLKAGWSTERALTEPVKRRG